MYAPALAYRPVASSPSYLSTSLGVVPTQMRAAAEMYEFWRKEKQVRAGRGKPSPFWVRTVTQIKAQHKFFRM